MKLLPYLQKQCLLFISLILIGAIAKAQFPVGPFSIPKNKTIKIVYEVTTNNNLPSVISFLNGQNVEVSPQLQQPTHLDSQEVQLAISHSYITESSWES